MIEFLGVPSFGGRAEWVRFAPCFAPVPLCPLTQEQPILAEHLPSGSLAREVDPNRWTKQGHSLATPHPVVMTAILHTWTLAHFSPLSPPRYKVFRAAG